ncbi:MFS transporter [Streptomyces sp. 71268]|uniref:MFS transporter n=1 Tax=Streptomyces sp. 71268 TaxID=3002640 RepID=UPI0023F878E3|nr:MFS transporter [Streptomyces sp. 71268]WEV27112.1 MFS transporter [Streptomyces sp. 71268]
MSARRTATGAAVSVRGDGPRRHDVAGGPADGRAVVPLWWVWLAAWPVTAVFALSNAATPLYVLWQDELGFSGGTLTVVFASYIVGLLASLLCCGVLSDRFGRRPVLLPALGLALAACLLFATAHHVTVLIVARLLTGLAVGAAVSAGMAAVTDVAGPDRRRLGALLASSAMVFGAGLGPLLSGVLSETLPAPTVTVFLVEAALLGTAALVVWRMPVPRPVPGLAPVPRASAGPGGGKGRDRDRGGDTDRVVWVRVPGVPRGSGWHLALGVAVFGPGIVATSFVLSLGPSLLTDLLGSGSRIVPGALAFAMFLASTCVQFAVQRRSRHTILVGGAVSVVFGMATLVVAVHTATVWALVAAAVLAGAGQGMGQLGGLSLLNSSVPTHRLAEANAALSVGGYAPAGLLAVGAGYLTDAVGLTSAATTFAVTLAAAAGLGGALVVARRSRGGNGQPVRR